ncbi:MAG TPA: cyclopropane-fatty-acyl-phospholipid synthase family protein [Bacteroidota bacterium]|nr:cyclopropane-fatty-acyl-phospholipid synthase family protein [Bacteroidota bacterium]
MRAQETLTHTGDVETGLSIVRHLFSHYHPRNFRIRFWDGTAWEPEEGQHARFTMVLRHPGALRRMFLHADELRLGEAYIFDDFDIEGDFQAALQMGERLISMKLSLAERAYVAGLLLRLPSDGKARTGRQAAALDGGLHSKERDRMAVTYHYDVPGDFFALWLDRRMVYSCAYFKTPRESLDAAQARKLDYTSRKLRLRPGERLLDIGCGWGGLIIHAAKRYRVHALGVTLSGPQAALANERIRAEGVGKLCRADVMDYRDIGPEGSFDKIVSIGMVEHVGGSMLERYFETAFRLLKPGGVLLNHGIGEGIANPGERGTSFSDRYLFPDTELVPIGTTVDIAEECGFEVRDVESLREHYALTLRAWLKGLERNHARALRFVDEATYRTWRLCHAGAAMNFDSGRHTVYQVLLVKPDNGAAGLPLTRGDWYSRGGLPRGAFGATAPRRRRSR